jgi:acid stress-induced BolA-like protein IbaG/YrbA
MNADDVARLIEENVPDAEASVEPQRGPEDDHYVAVVVSPAFEAKTLVEQHSMVQEALGEHLTTDIHAVDLKTYTPEEYESRE